MASKDDYPPAYPHPTPPQPAYQDPGHANAYYQSAPPMGYPQQGHGGPYPPPDQYGGQPPYQQGGYPPQGYPYQQPYQQQPYQQYPPQGYQEERGGGGKKGLLGGLAAALACCCCLDILF